MEDIEELGEERTKGQDDCDEAEVTDREADQGNKVERRTNIDESQVQWNQQEET